MPGLTTKAKESDVNSGIISIWTISCECRGDLLSTREGHSRSLSWRDQQRYGNEVRHHDLDLRSTISYGMVGWVDIPFDLGGSETNSIDRDIIFLKQQERR